MYSRDVLRSLRYITTIVGTPVVPNIMELNKLTLVGNLLVSPDLSPIRTPDRGPTLVEELKGRSHVSPIPDPSVVVPPRFLPVEPPHSVHSLRTSLQGQWW